MTELFIGTSGWSYKEWIGPFYPDSKNWFSYYSKVFNTVEINSTFYAYPPESLVKGLSRTSPNGFLFSAKIPKLITHKKMLDIKKGVEADLRKFLNLMSHLYDQEKLGPLLFQLPPRSTDSFSNFEGFLKILPVDVFKFVVEFRDESWLNDESFRLLRENNIGYCIVDEPLLPDVTVVTSDFAYIRWHGRGIEPWYYYDYKEDELRRWSRKVLDLKGNVKEIFGYFNNHFRAYAPKNALQILEIMGVANDVQKEQLEKITSYFEVGATEWARIRIQKALLSGDMKELLSVFIDKSRMHRAVEIENEPIYTLLTKDLVQGTIRDYDFIIDVRGRILKHNCEDFVKRSGTKQFCKHIGKVFLNMPPDISMFILKDIAQNLEKWQFEKT